MAPLDLFPEENEEVPMPIDLAPYQDEPLDLWIFDPNEIVINEEEHSIIDEEADTVEDQENAEEHQEEPLDLSIIDLDEIVINEEELSIIDEEADTVVHAPNNMSNFGTDQENAEEHQEEPLELSVMDFDEIEIKEEDFSNMEEEADTCTCTCIHVPGSNLTLSEFDTLLTAQYEWSLLEEAASRHHLEISDVYGADQDDHLLEEADDPQTQIFPHVDWSEVVEAIYLQALEAQGEEEEEEEEPFQPAKRFKRE